MCEFLFVITCHVYFQGANYNPFALLENNFPVTQGKWNILKGNEYGSQKKKKKKTLAEIGKLVSYLLFFKIGV